MERKSAEQEHLRLDYMLNRSPQSDRFRQDFGIYWLPGTNVPIVSYQTCESPYCDNPIHFIHLATFEITYELKRGIEA